MRKIGSKIRKKGFELNLVTRSENWAVFEQHHPTAGLIAYEVVRIKVLKAGRVMDGNLLPEREVIASTSDWGTYGFTFGCFGDHEKAKNAAYKKFTELSQKE